MNNSLCISGLPYFGLKMCDDYRQTLLPNSFSPPVSFLSLTANDPEPITAVCGQCCHHSTVSYFTSVLASLCSSRKTHCSSEFFVHSHHYENTP